MRFLSGNEDILRYKLDYDDYYVLATLVNYGSFIKSKYDYLFDDEIDLWKTTSLSIISKDISKIFYLDILYDDRGNISKIIFSNGSGAKRVCKIHRYSFDLSCTKGIRRYKDLVIEDGIVYPESTKSKYYGDIYYYDEDNNTYISDKNNIIPSDSLVDDDILLSDLCSTCFDIDDLFNKYFDRKHKRPRSLNLYNVRI